MKYMPVSLTLQEYINVVQVFQYELIPHFNEIKEFYGFYELEHQKIRRNTSAYHKLLKATIFHDFPPYNFSISSVVMLDNVINKFQLFCAPKKESSGIFGFVAKLENERYKNRISLSGYVPDHVAKKKARNDLLQIMSIDENYNLIYKIPDFLSRENFIIFNQR